MTDREALLAAIHADPDDDTARLVFADWLQENGQADRAEFIRFQIQAARADPFSLRARKAEERARYILDVHFEDWTRHLQGGMAHRPRFERGFVAHLSVEPRGFVPRADDLLNAEPVQALTLYRFAGIDERVSLAPFFELPRLRQLRRFELSSMLIVEEEHRAEEFRLLSSCTHLERLRELSLRHNPVPPTWLSEVLRNRFPALAALDVADNTHLGPTLAENLPVLNDRKFRKLDLSRIPFSSDEIKQVLRSRCLSSLGELRLGIVPGRDSGPLIHLDLGFVIPWDHLVLLDLTGQKIGNHGVSEITRQKEAASLRWLNLAHNGLGADAVHYLIDSPHLSLNYLNVTGNDLTLSQQAALQRRFPNAVIES